MAEETVKVRLNQTRNIYDRGVLCVGDGVTTYELTKENAQTAVEQGWGLEVSDSKLLEGADKGQSPTLRAAGGGMRGTVPTRTPRYKVTTDKDGEVPVTPEVAHILVVPDEDAPKAEAEPKPRK